MISAGSVGYFLSGKQNRAYAAASAPSVLMPFGLPSASQIN